MKTMLLWVAILVAVIGTYAVVKIGPRNVIGMIRYDQRREGELKVGDKAPDAKLVALDGKTPLALLPNREKPTVLIFGSFT
jgi:hypothetical protein